MIYFAYGANLCKAHMALWCPGSEPLIPAVLPGHRLVFRFWADIVPSAGDNVHGALYQVTKSDLVDLEEFEDCPALSEQVGIEVRSAEGLVDAVTYRMRPGYSFAPPAEEYLRLIEQGYKDWSLDPAVLPLRAET
jgi:gamma-glutamylcyclotransferase (GGCT)/AIG2-like uncharacterized protein YtfP